MKDTNVIPETGAVRVKTMQFETTIKEVIPRVPGVKSFRFSRSSTFTYKAGQFMFVTIKSDSGDLKKHFTLSSSPTEFGHIEFTKRLTGSPYSNALELLKVGDWAQIDAPYGNFTFEGEYEKLAMLTGGIGITPFRSICRYVEDKRLNTDIILIYGNRSEQDIVFKDELENIQKKTFKLVHTLEKPSIYWQGLRGFIDEDMIKREIPDYFERVFYICGPPVMINAMEKILTTMGIEKDRVKTERFIGY